MFSMFSSSVMPSAVGDVEIMGLADETDGVRTRIQHAREHLVVLSGSARRVWSYRRR